MTEEKNKEIILVVEDEDIARKNLEHILVKTGYDVISVNNEKKPSNCCNQQALIWSSLI
jgi:CheY-like chemotaxis protein